MLGFRTVQLFVLALLVVSSGLLGVDSTEKIDQEIQSLQIELDELRKKTFNKEMEAQPMMFNKWHEYADDLEASESGERQILELKKKIEQLKEQKLRLSPP